MKGIFCYRNLNRKGVVWSVKSNRTGLVVARPKTVVIKDAQLVVSQAGRRRVLAQKKKNVHAGIRGTWVKSDWDKHVLDWRGMSCIYDDLTMRRLEWKKIIYNPYQYETFVWEDTKLPVTHARVVILDETGCWAYKPVGT